MKHTARLTACLLALALTACTAAPQDMPAGTTTETAAAPAQTAEPTTETPAVQDTLTPIYTTWGASVGRDAVYSAMNIDDAGQYFATTIDFSTGEQRILCKKFGCSHADESCPAYMTAIRNGCVPEAMLLPVGDRLYWLVDGRYNESDGAYLDVSNTDGSDRRRVAEGDDLPDLTNALSGTRMAQHCIHLCAATVNLPFCVWMRAVRRASLPTAYRTARIMSP